jgi:hypothetical protein
MSMFGHNKEEGFAEIDVLKGPWTLPVSFSNRIPSPQLTVTLPILPKYNSLRHNA